MTIDEAHALTALDTDSEAHDFAEMRRRRAELLESINALELALAAPGQQMRWAERVSSALMELSGDFRDHVELTEGATGLYTHLIRSSPRLVHEVDRLTQEHTKLAELIGALLNLLGQREKTTGESDPPIGDHAKVREAGTTLLVALVRHRQRGADLVYEAYSVDIGGQD